MARGKKRLQEYLGLVHVKYSVHFFFFGSLLFYLLVIPFIQINAIMDALNLDFCLVDDLGIFKFLLLYFKSGKHGIYNEKPGTDGDKNDAG